MSDIYMVYVIMREREKCLVSYRILSKQTPENDAHRTSCDYDPKKFLHPRLDIGKKKIFSRKIDIPYGVEKSDEEDVFCQ